MRSPHFATVGGHGRLVRDERYFETQLFTIIPVPQAAVHAADVAGPIG
jgi:hypothetical protein